MNLITFLTQFSYLAVFLLIFTECGIPFGFFFPGDSLLITTGILAYKGIFNFYLLILIGIVAAILGNLTGYFLGQKWGRPFFERKSNFVFNPKNLKKTEEFYQKYGDETIILARFVPVVRTFAPIFAGIAKMKIQKFILYTIFSALIWMGLLISAGYFLIQIVPQIENHLLPLILGVIFISALPLLFKLLKKT